MADTQYKTVTLYSKTQPEAAPSWNVRGLAPGSYLWFERVHRSQDTLLGGHRPLLSYHHGGLTGGWVVEDGDPASTTYPDDSTWRVMARAKAEVAPGSNVECRVLAVRSGSEDTNDSVYGAVRYGAAFENGANSESTAYYDSSIPGSLETYGAVGTSDGWEWLNLRYVYLEPHWPGAPNQLQLVERDKWSEFSEATLSLEVQGGARVLMAQVCEVPQWHVHQHDTDAATVHASDLIGGKKTQGPRESASDGATYEERRFGTHRMVDVAERQETRLGPTLWTWSSHTENATAAGDAEAPAVSSTGTSFVALHDTSVTAWDADEPGFAMPTYYAQRDHERGTLAHSAVSPVLIRVYHSTTVGATVRVQTTARSWVDIDLPVTAGYEWTQATAYLECDPAPDVHRATAQMLVKHDSGGSCAVRYVACHFDGRA